MDEWEYMSIAITVEQNEWVATSIHGGKLLGLHAIWNYYASRDWELVTVFPTDISGSELFASVSINITRVIATFKRRKASIPPNLLPQE